MHALQAESIVSDELFEAKAERDHAVQKALRLEARIERLFSAELRSDKGNSSATAQGHAAATSRENELMVTISAFQRALEQKNKAIGHMVPASKYMQVCDDWADAERCNVQTFAARPKAALQLQEVNGHKVTKKGLKKMQQELQDAHSLKADMQKLEQHVSSLRSANTTLKQTLASERAKAVEVEEEDTAPRLVRTQHDRVVSLVCAQL
jgi:hypothetical protein